MVQQSEHHITIGFHIVGSMGMCDAPIVEGATMGTSHMHMLPTIANHIER